MTYRTRQYTENQRHIIGPRRSSRQKLRDSTLDWTSWITKKSAALSKILSHNFLSWAEKKSKEIKKDEKWNYLVLY